jgi:hypothetical protein
MATVKDLRDLLEEYAPEDQIIFQLFTRDHAEFTTGEIKPEEWDQMVKIFDHDPIDTEAFGLHDLLDQAREAVK